MKENHRIEPKRGCLVHLPLSCKAKKYKSAESAQQKKNDNNI